MRARAITSLAVLGAAAALAACGGGGQPSNDDVKASWQPVRTDLLDLGSRIGASLRNAGSSTDAQLAAQFERYSRELADLRRRVDAIDGNDATQPKLDALSSDYVKAGKDIDALVSAAKANDAQAAVKAVRALSSDASASQSDRQALDKTLGIHESTASSAGGQVNVTFQPPQSHTDAIGAQILKEGKIPQIAATLARTFELPQTLTVQAVNGFGDGPFYDQQANSITFPYEFATLVLKTLRDSNPQWSGHRLGFAVGSVDGFVLEHEFGHALIHIYNLPVLGREEDAADNIASLLLLQSPEGGRLAFGAAEFWADLAQRQSPPALVDYADAHSLDLQRAFTIVCNIAGSSPQRLREVAQLHILPQSRLQGCPAEYRNNVVSLKQVLQPHLKRPLNLGG